jgi:hypothetical protein
MKAYLIIDFDYEYRYEGEQEDEILDLLIGFGEFCEDTEFEFQCIPRVGEYIRPEEMVKQWIRNKDYKKPCPDREIGNKITDAFRTGYFKVEEIFHSSKTCTLHCSDIDYENLRKK